MEPELSDEEKEEILNDHIPYRLTQIRNHSKHKEFYSRILPNPYYRRHEICAIEAGFIAGRQLLEFLGISYDRKNKVIKPRPERKVKADDLCIALFDLPPVDLSMLTADEKSTLSTFYHRANKGSGHFTWEKREKDGFETIDEGTKIIERLLKEFLYDPLKIEMKEKE